MFSCTPYAYIETTFSEFPTVTHVLYELREGTKREVKKSYRSVPSQWCHREDATRNTERGAKEKERKRGVEKREREREREITEKESTIVCSRRE